MSVQCFIHLKSQFQEKNPVLPNTEISVSCAIQERDNIRITTPHYPVFLLSVKWSLTGGKKKTQKFQTVSSKRDRGRLREVVAFKRFHCFLTLVQFQRRFSLF